MLSDIDLDSRVFRQEKSSDCVKICVTVLSAPLLSIHASVHDNSGNFNFATCTEEDGIRDNSCIVVYCVFYLRTRPRLEFRS